MRIISSLDELKLDGKRKGFLVHFLSNVSRIENVKKVFLFGSCAREQFSEFSDIDLFVTTAKKLPENEEFHIMFDCPPSYKSENYLPSDILVQSEEDYEKFKNEFGMVQKQINYEGVDLSELL